ncbi:MAG: DUF402 domain-containing protein [Chloroflexota bacterium]|nr:DUF402 domain-containing protein [Chloroflexota bacterium]
MNERDNFTEKIDKHETRMEKPLTIGDPVIVVKLDEGGTETRRYQAILVLRDKNRLILEAYFNQEDMQFHGMFLGKGDRFIETYYTDRWYNIFEVHAREDDQIRGWYCNIACPIQVKGNTLSYIDLALDLLIFPDGREIVLDEDEFERLDISPAMRSKALQSLQELRESFNSNSKTL